jgi:translation initiation factor IF-3
MQRRPARVRIRINRQIRAEEVRVINPDDEQLGVMTVSEALRIADSLDLDLVEISPNAKPPVCKIVDYGKFKYLQKKKEQEAKKHQAVTMLKEVKLRPRTDKHDREYKMKNLRRFLEEGNKAKVTMRFRGREIVYAERAKQLMEEIATELQDVGKMEKFPTRVGRTLSMVLSPLSRPKQ